MLPSVQSLNLSECDLMVKIIFSEIVSNGYYNQNVKVKVNFSETLKMNVVTQERSHPW